MLNTEDYESIPEDEWIASDMTMYDSPLAELERQQCYLADTANTFATVYSVSSPEPEPVATQSEKPSTASAVDVESSAP